MVVKANFTNGVGLKDVWFGSSDRSHIVSPCFQCHSPSLSTISILKLVLSFWMNHHESHGGTLAVVNEKVAEQ